MLMELEPHKATGLDGLQAKVLIDSAQSITHIMNMSIFSGLFLKKQKKTTKVIPIHKKNSKVHLPIILHVIIIFINCNLVFESHFQPNHV